MKKDIFINSWLHLQELLFNDTYNERLKRNRSSFVFRGVSRASYELKTSLNRIENVDAEYHLLRNFRKYAKRELNVENNDWELMALGQHYGLPTRLLDWTFSPFVALHFATIGIDVHKYDSAIWCVDIRKVNELLPPALKDILQEEQSSVFTVEMLGGKWKDIKEFDGFQKSIEGNFVFFLEPPSIDERIINQYAIFSVMSNRKVLLDEWLKNHPDCYKKIIIPANLKLEIRDHLDQLNINERLIYPGLEGISSWLKRYYEIRKDS